jgi:hypothetical protein
MSARASNKRRLSGYARRVLVDLVLRYENDPVILAMVQNMRRGIGKPSKMVKSFSCN